MNQETDINLSEHLEDLRKRVIISLVVISVLSILSFFFSDTLMAIISAPVKHNIRTLYFLSPYEAFMVKLNISLVSGIVLSVPVIFTQLWRFVSPGLYTKEQRTILPLIFVSTILFVLGALFAYFLVIPFAFKFFMDFQTLTLVPLISIGSYISLFLSLILIFGLVFDLPVVLLGLISLGVVQTSFLSHQRKIVIVLIFIVAAVLTPTVDILTQCLLALALWLLFEVSVWIGKALEKRRTRVDT